MDALPSTQGSIYIMWQQVFRGGRGQGLIETGSHRDRGQHMKLNISKAVAWTTVNLQIFCTVLFVAKFANKTNSLN